MSTIGKLALGALIDKGANRLLDRDKFNRNQFNILTGGGYTGEDEEKDTGSKTLGSIAKTGIMSLIANAIFGPIFAPLALSLGQRFVDRRQAQGLGLNPFGGSGTSGPAGIMSGKVQTLDGRIVDSDSDEARADLNARDKEFEETGDYDVYSNTATTGPTYSGKATEGTRFDAEDDGGGSDDSSSGGGGTTSSSDQGETSSDSGFSDSGSYEDFGTMYARGGLASLYR